MVCGDSHILQLVSSYFQDMFETNGVDSDALDVVLSSITPTTTNDMNQTLLQSFTLNEVFSVLKLMGPDKSSGVDGISTMFYQSNWDTVGPLVTTVVIDLLQNQGDFASINSTFDHFNSKNPMTTSSVRLQSH